MTGKLELLLVEDNPADAELTRENLADAKLLHELEVVGDGLEALQFLRNQGRYREASRPDLILLDLNLPGMDGHELLAELAADPSLCQIPVVVLTSSRTEEDVLRFQHLPARAYVTKPVDLEGLGRIVRTIEGVWFSIVRLPPETVTE